LEKNKKKITFVTVSRSDFGIMKNIIKTSSEIKEIETSLIITGTHFSKKFGKTIQDIKKEKFIKKIDLIKELKLDYFNSFQNQTNIYLANIMKMINNFLLKYKPDKVILIGDRYEMLAVALSCFNLNIKTYHFCGGSETFGSLDDKYRNIISLLSQKHFVETSYHMKNLTDLKIEKKKIFITGAPALENIDSIKFENKDKLTKKYKLNIKKNEKIILATFHPETTKTIAQNIKNLKIMINFLKQINQIVIFTYPGADFGFNEYIKTIENSKNKKFFRFKNLGTQEYYRFLRVSDLVIGNSSSGIIETGAFKIPTIDIGERQKNRIRNINVFNSSFNLKNLRVTYKKIFNKKTLIQIKSMNDLYKIKMNSSQIIKKILN
jgi:GDP/UDP-N,N'-diacetylbacillosamine 2-epimerase (hydrolysing)